MPVFGDGVMRLDGVAKVKGVLFADIFDTEVVNDEGEHDGSPLVAPKARSAFTLVVAFVGETLSEEGLGEDAVVDQRADVR